MQNRRNYYRILQVQPDAPVEVIRASFRALMKELKLHPDLGGSASSAALLNEAVTVLGDPALRARYDRSLFARYTKRSLSAASPAGDPLITSFCSFCKTPLARRPRPGEVCPVCRSPLQSRGPSQLERLSRRAVARMKRTGRVSYRSRWPQRPQDATLLDLSPAGMRFLCRDRLAPGTVLRISGPGFEACAAVKNLRVEEVDGEKLHAVGVAFLAVEFDNPRGCFLSTSA